MLRDLGLTVNCSPNFCTEECMRGGVSTGKIDYRGSYQSIFLSLAVHQLTKNEMWENPILFFMTSLQMVVDSRGIPPFDYSQSMN